MSDEGKSVDEITYVLIVIIILGLILLSGNYLLNKLVSIGIIKVG